MPLPSKVHPDHTYVHLAAMQPEKHLLFVVNTPVYRYNTSDHLQRYSNFICGTLHYRPCNQYTTTYHPSEAGLGGYY
ncbi:hypothetical protein K443DRAFT_676890 [Laccaria amethystina LaAM-08-1]|uniref:Uncharacterized protein n=1 Tax=Laccaria amethystina LaAM-08-1 TaxID=1095629 RepID=A0A0C9WV25_9AGAR|nr:hypothetical protein K443DRAFT_676890 [Laccaria amethystina LaAM-08-1]